MNQTPLPPVALPRLLTGIDGLDTLTHGGPPVGETTLLCGTTGTGKSVLALQFLAAGIIQFDQPAVFVTFEQPPEKLRRLAAGFGWDIAAWEQTGRWAFVDASWPDSHEVVVGEQLDLGPLLARIAAAVRRTAAKRVVLDTLTTVQMRLGDAARVRSELRRVIGSLDLLGVTAIITAERDSDYGAVARYGVEEFVADNIIILRYVLTQERRRRTIEVLKLRGARHGAREYPFSIDERHGVVIMTLSDIGLEYPSSDARVSIGNPDLDAMCGGGAMRGSVTLVSGTTGTGKSQLAIEFLTAGDNDERAMLIAFEESEAQIERNATACGHDLETLKASGRLRLHCAYGSSATLERHLAQVIDLLDEYHPTRLAIDGLSALKNVSTRHDFLDLIADLTALVKARQITTFYTIAPPLFDALSATEVEASTIIDAIILLRYIEIYGELHRGIAVLKMRGSDHDKRIRDLQIGAGGTRIGDAFRTTTGIIPGAAIQLLGAEGERVEALFDHDDRPADAGDLPGSP